MLWFSIVSMNMIFAGLTSAMFVSKSDNWFSFDLPYTLWISSAVILVSSITMQQALHAAKNGAFSKVRTMMMATLVLGLTFTALQFVSWVILVQHNVFFVGNDTSASFLYVITAAHLAHLLFGLVALVVSWTKSLKNKYTPGQTVGLELTAIFWHFLDGLWIYLFLFLLYIR